MEIYDLWITCSIFQLFWLAISETKTHMFVITRWHISSVTAPHISLFRALSSTTKAGFFGSSFVSRCPRGRRRSCYVWTVVRSVKSMSLVSRTMLENHSLAQSVTQEVWSNVGCVWCRPICMKHWILSGKQVAMNWAQDLCSMLRAVCHVLVGGEKMPANYLALPAHVTCEMKHHLHELLYSQK